MLKTLFLAVLALVFGLIAGVYLSNLSLLLVFVVWVVCVARVGDAQYHSQFGPLDKGYYLILYGLFMAATILMAVMARLPVWLGYYLSYSRGGWFLR